MGGYRGWGELKRSRVGIDRWGTVKSEGLVRVLNCFVLSRMTFAIPVGTKIEGYGIWGDTYELPSLSDNDKLGGK